MITTCANRKCHGFVWNFQKIKWWRKTNHISVFLEDGEQIDQHIFLTKFKYYVLQQTILTITYWWHHLLSNGANLFILLCIFPSKIKYVHEKFFRMCYNLVFELFIISYPFLPRNNIVEMICKFVICILNFKIINVILW